MRDSDFYFCMVKAWLENHLEHFLFVLMALVLFYGCNFMPLSADEPIRALIALDMKLNGHFLTPELNGDSYLNKPPLYNWILLALFQLTGSYSEWVIRLPSLISLLIFMLVIRHVVVKHLHDKTLGWLTAFAFATTGNLLFYSSYLGHIDVLYSLVTFLQLYWLIHFLDQKKLWMAFGLSYTLAAAGFLMKGLPSVVFQGLSLLVLIYHSRQWKQLFAPAHLISIGCFVVPVATYLWAFSRNGSAVDLLQRLLTESTDRTIASKSILQSMAHLLEFPALFAIDLLPWSLLFLIFLHRPTWQKIWSRPFLRKCLLVFLANLAVYWLSPDYRARYIFMLIPFILIPLMYGLILWKPEFKRSPVLVLLALAVLTIGGFIYISGPFLVRFPYVELAAVLFILLLTLRLFGGGKMALGGAVSWFAPVMVLIALRLSYSALMVPFRVETGPYLEEKQLALRMAEIVKDEPVYMYHCNVSLSMNWYISASSGRMLTTKRADFDSDAFYLVPDDVITDRENVVVFDTFVRRYLRKPMSLVKFKNYFPPMPK